ncbi:hypothetical protein V1283_004370 [Bradyrhizobium sp. AZCC 2262]
MLGEQSVPIVVGSLDGGVAEATTRRFMRWADMEAPSNDK